MSKNDESIEFGELLMILIQCDAVYFVIDVYKTDYHSEYHLYSVAKSMELQCIHINDLVDYYPLPSYVTNGLQVIPLKHGVLSK